MSKEISLTMGYVAIVDDIDHARLSAYKWQASKRGANIYASTDIDRKKVYMHRMILNAPADMTVDHISGNGLDNRRSNLRLATLSQNSANRRRMLPNAASKYRGVFLVSNKKSWRAQIFYQGQTIYLGCFLTQWEAAQAYNEAAIKHFGEYAVLNTIAPQPDPDDVPFPKPTKPTNPYIGVSKGRRNGWLSRVKVNGKEIHLGTYPTPEQAATVRDQYVLTNSLGYPLNFS